MSGPRKQRYVQGWCFSGIDRVLLFSSFVLLIYCLVFLILAFIAPLSNMSSDNLHFMDLDSLVLACWDINPYDCFKYFGGSTSKRHI